MLVAAERTKGLLFASAASAISEKGKSWISLQAIAGAAKDQPKGVLPLAVVGTQADPPGNAAANQRLSERPGAGGRHLPYLNATRLASCRATFFSRPLR
jgi:hypothetical protein